jgi:hypothetical protein
MNIACCATLASLLCGGCLLVGGDAAAERERRRAEARDDDTTRTFKLLGRDAIWRPAGRVSMSWRTFHTQGLAKVGSTFFVSSVEVLEPRVPSGASSDALYDFSLDRSAGAGRGWLSKFDATGTLLGQVELTAGDIYHPGGIDFDGRFLWVPVSEYRPNSRSNIYRVDPESLAAELVFSEADAIGGIVRNRRVGTLHGLSWGSRRLYTWRLHGDDGLGSLRVAHPTWAPNPQFYLDYQDCHYQGVEYMLCGGVARYATPYGPLAFGGLDLVDLRSHRMVHQVPVPLFTDEGAGPNPELSLMHNAFWVEPHGEVLRVYTMNESNDQADLVVHDVTPWMLR